MVKNTGRSVPAARKAAAKKGTPLKKVAAHKSMPLDRVPPVKKPAAKKAPSKPIRRSGKTKDLVGLGGVGELQMVAFGVLEKAIRSAGGRVDGMKISVSVPGHDPVVEVVDSKLDQPDLVIEADPFDPATHEARDASHFRRIVQAKNRVEAAELELRDAVAAAREAGDSWVIIGAAMGTTRQGAYQRFGKTEARR